VQDVDFHTAKVSVTVRVVAMFFRHLQSNCESKPQGLKPDLLQGVSARAKARTYLKSKGNSNSNGKATTTTTATAGPSTPALAMKLREPSLRMTILEGV
jgi:hypothetical protein